MYPEAEQIKQIIDHAKRVVIMQADNPDGDSLGSALALEQILGDLGKATFLYCGVSIPSYLHYLDGWDRVETSLPSQFDVSIIVDTSADSLFEILERSGQRSWLTTKPCVVIDHHSIELAIPYATIHCNHQAVATGEVIYELASQLNMPMNLVAKQMLVSSIMSDSLGLTVEATTARSIGIVAELVGGGVSIAALENKRRELMRKSPALVHYKGELLQRVEYSADNRIATITIPWDEIERYSQEYNPSVLVLEDMRNTISTAVAIAFKSYPNGRVTAKIRANLGFAIADKLAKHFKGGGHPYASGFKIEDSRSLDSIKVECIEVATQLLDQLTRGTTTHETS